MLISTKFINLLYNKLQYLFTEFTENSSNDNKVNITYLNPLLGCYL